MAQLPKVTQKTCVLQAGTLLNRQHGSMPWRPLLQTLRKGMLPGGSRLSHGCRPSETTIGTVDTGRRHWRQYINGRALRFLCSTTRSRWLELHTLGLWDFVAATTCADHSINRAQDEDAFLRHAFQTHPGSCSAPRSITVGRTGHVSGISGRTGHSQCLLQRAFTSSLVAFFVRGACNNESKV